VVSRDVTEDVRSICVAMKDPVTGKNTCQELVEDKRCVGTSKSVDLVAITSNALVNNDAEAKIWVCECSCFSHIVDVFSKIANLVRSLSCSIV